MNNKIYNINDELEGLAHDAVPETVVSEESSTCLCENTVWMMEPISNSLFSKIARVLIHIVGRI